MSYDFSEEISLQSETTYFVNDFLERADSDQTNVPGGFSERLRNFDSIEQELRLNYDGDRLRGTAGLFFTRFELDSRTNGLVGAFGFNTLNIDTVTNYAAFGEVEFDVLEDLTLIAGLRYDREELDLFSSFVSLAGFPPPDPGTNINETYTAILPKGGIVYRFTEDHSLGFTAQKGYRAGGALRRGITGDIVPFDPETSWTFELAGRSQWLDGALTANANAYYTIWRDMQVNVPGVPIPGSPLPPFAFIIIDRSTANSGRSRLFGGEIELIYEPTDNIELFASGAYNNTRLIDFTSGGTVFDGNEFPDAPKFTAAFGGTYAFDEGWFISADASYTSSAFTDVGNTPALKSDARFLVNARAGYRDENFEVFAYTRNLFDEEYAISLVANPVPGAPGATVSRVGEPLTFGVVGQVNF